MENATLDLWQLIREGAISTYPLIACSIVALGVTLERLVSLRGVMTSTTALTAKVVTHVLQGDLARAVETVAANPPCPARRIFADVLAAERGASVADLDRIADERQFEEVQGANAYLWILATALGLAVGIVAVALYNYFQARVERFDAALRIGSSRVIDGIAASRRAHGAQGA